MREVLPDRQVRTETCSDIRVVMGATAAMAVVRVAALKAIMAKAELVIGVKVEAASTKARLAETAMGRAIVQGR